MIGFVARDDNLNFGCEIGLPLLDGLSSQDVHHYLDIYGGHVQSAHGMYCGQYENMDRQEPPSYEAIIEDCTLGYDGVGGVYWY